MGAKNQQVPLPLIQAKIRETREELKSWRAKLISRALELVRQREITSAEAGEIIMEGVSNGSGVAGNLAGAV